MLSQEGIHIRNENQKWLKSGLFDEKFFWLNFEVNKIENNKLSLAEKEGSSSTIFSPIFDHDYAKTLLMFDEINDNTEF